MHYAANIAFTLATLFSYQALCRAENAFVFDDETQQIERVEDERLSSDVDSNNP